MKVSRHLPSDTTAHLSVVPPKPSAWSETTAVAALALAVTLGLACGSAKTPAPTLPPSVEASQESSDPPPAAPTLPMAKNPERTIVIEEGGSSDQPSLLEAAAAERERRRNTPPAAIVINNQNLKDKATGKLTIAEPAANPPTEDEPAEDGPADEERGADYWRGAALNARLTWRQAADEITRWQEETDRLRRRFYDEDDPYYRDSQIKPAWDQAMDRLREARLSAEMARAELERVLEEGRRAGALPGWLREGIDLEPVAEPRTDELPEHEIQEPTIYEPEDDGGPG